MALHRGIQSALFYYISCAPCTEARTRRNRRREADLARAEKVALQNEQPELYQYYSHPLPSNTNPGWELEIAIGPSKESKAAAKQKSKKDSNETPPRSSASTNKSDRAKTPGSSPDLPRDGRAQWAMGFQRPGSSAYLKENAASSKLANPLTPLPEGVDTTSVPTVTKPKPTRLATTSLSSPAWPHSNPPLNDLHPATVTNYDSAKDISWMLEPPPPAKVMQGDSAERPHRYKPRSRTTTHSTTEHHACAGADMEESRSPSDKRGLPNQGGFYDYDHDQQGDVAVESEEEEEEEDYELAAEGSQFEKRDSAGPAPGRDEAGGHLFPPKDDVWERRDSGADEAWHFPPAEGSKNAAARDSEINRVKWRWSIDW